MYVYGKGRFIEVANFTGHFKSIHKKTIKFGNNNHKTL